MTCREAATLVLIVILLIGVGLSVAQVNEYLAERKSENEKEIERSARAKERRSHV